MFSFPCRKCSPCIYFHTLLALTTAAVYYVEPDDGESCPYQHCHVLQYYANKLLDSYSQLHFLSGTFHLSSDFVLSNAHNISLTGSRAAKSTTPNTIIQCKLSASIAVINTTGLIIRDMVIKNCGPSSTKPLYTVVGVSKDAKVWERTVTIKNCSSVHLHNLHIKNDIINYGLYSYQCDGVQPDQ